jgi:RNA 3'-terminal phosphate cyclase (ATP)
MGEPDMDIRRFAQGPALVCGNREARSRMRMAWDGGATLDLDGSHGEGGGQILRTGVALAALTGRTVRFRNIRARRRIPGLAAQHLTAVRAAAALCSARLENDALGSTELMFAPQAAVRAASYRFDVGAAREGGSAGAASLVLQTILTPLCLVGGRSDVVVEGGTHNPRSPPFDYLCDVWLKTLARMGAEADMALEAWGWYPIGKGRIRAAISGRPRSLSSLELRERGALRAIKGRAVAANLPSHIPTRMKERARASLAFALRSRPWRRKRSGGLCGSRDLSDRDL